ncbi:MAG: NAD-dependent epimerase/dehydratase family protein [Candidatus Ranarchaeia archaeon]
MDNKKEIQKFTISLESSIKDTMKKIDLNGWGLIFIINENDKFQGLVTDGDIRRSILRGITINTKIEEIMNKNPIKYLKTDIEQDKEKILNESKIREKIPKSSSIIIPILNNEKHIVSILMVQKVGGKLIVKDLFSKDEIIKQKPVKRVLLIGGAGYIGSIVSRLLLEKGYYVRVLDNLLYGDEGIKELMNKENFEFIKGNMLHIDEIIQAIDSVDAVVHLAAIVGDPACKTIPSQTIQTNYLSSMAIAEACKTLQINRLIFLSTCSVYGYGDSILNEHSSLAPLSLYAETKVKSEKGILSIVDENFSPTILRLATVYGYSPRMRFDLAVNLITVKALIEKEFSIFGGKQWRPFIHVYDVARAILKVLQAPIEKVKSEIFNVGSEKQNYNFIDLGKQISNEIKEAKMNLVQDKEDERSYRVSFKKIQDTIGFEPKRNLKNSINELREKVEKGKFSDYKLKKYSNYKSIEAKVM